MRKRKKEKMKKMFMEIMDERFREYRGTDLWQRVIDLENKMETQYQALKDLPTTMNAVLAHPNFRNLAGK
jgi:hypothetical protein